MTSLMTATGWELAERNQIRAFRVNRHLLITAEGNLPTPGYDVDIHISPLKIFPQQFNLLQRGKPGAWPEVVTPYRYGEIVIFPEDHPTVIVHHAQGQDRIEIQKCGDDLQEFVAAVVGSVESPCPIGAQQATGFSRNWSFDEAFTNALDNLSSIDLPSPDSLTRIQILEMGALVSEAAGIRTLFIRVCHTGMV